MCSISLSEGDFFCSVIITTLSHFIFRIVRTGKFTIAFVGMNWNLFFVQIQHFVMLFWKFFEIGSLEYTSNDDILYGLIIEKRVISSSGIKFLQKQSQSAIYGSEICASFASTQWETLNN